MEATAAKNYWRDSWRDVQSLGRPAFAFIFTQLIGGLPLVLYALLHWHSEDFFRYVCFLTVALFASVLKVQLPGIKATMSANFLFILVGILDLSYSETLLMGCLGGLIQSLWQANPRPRPIQWLFNFANLALSISAAEFVFHSKLAAGVGFRWPLLIAAAATTYFAFNTLSVSGIIAMTEGRNPVHIWKECYLWAFPYYLLGALIACGVSAINRLVGWQYSILVFPIVYWIYRSYRIYLGRLEAQKKHAEEIAALHLRTIEALSLAIEAKDHTTHDHLRRVQLYAVEIAKELGLEEAQMNAVRAASMLHDIGKLAVPENILSKPGRLTPEEFEKMKIHPLVGAEILDRVQFPYPVVPIVRSHHEKWDGTGYPEGLRGEAIPIGARILSAVDCFDALASERPYRRAMSPEEAMVNLSAEKGRSFDPRVVEVMERRYRELEAMVSSMETERRRLDIAPKIDRNVAPSSGYAEAPNEAEVRAASFLTSIISARQEAQLLFELAQTLGNSLSLRETLSVVASRLKQMVPHDAIVFYICQDGLLIPEYAHGVDYDIFSTLRIPRGEGLSGWVALNEKPISNGNPAAETLHTRVPSRVTTLQAALSVPLGGHDGVAGVLTLYGREKNCFTKEHLRMLLAASSKLGLSVENALQYEKAQSTASTDFLTGLPNARSICQHLEKELARIRRSKKPLAVLLCDLNGFKKVNDTFGHLTGNKLLQEIAVKFRSSCRDYDQVGRLGGDEFVFVLPEVTKDTVFEVQERLTRAVQEASRAVCPELIVSVSVGSSFYPADGATGEELLSEADRSMYEVKEKHYSKAELIPSDFRANVD
ncbi:MAG TPA: HD domain-containing phosphohydrolase [Candidatus Sulfotelmatobacter sp.]|nr:HD domain-containing phosphohydrolase [Candidatus Sulfotelmatobacter sp.]